MLREYISRVKRLGPNDLINGDTFNGVLEELQHNMDLLYNQQKSSHVTWNVSDLVFGNLMDFDSTGQQRFVNGGLFDSIEKILPFESTVGTLHFEEIELLNQQSFMRWEVPEGITSNVRLVKNIAIPEGVRHQNLLISFKFTPYAGLEPVQNERYDIYVNGVHAGAGHAGTHKIRGIEEPRTLYGVYHLTGTESNIEVQLVRTSTNDTVPDNYKVRISHGLVTLHTLGETAFTMNFPVSGSSFIGAGADITAFYDFENNAVRPIPSFLINGDRLEGDGTLVVNITSVGPSIQDTYYVGISGTGNKLGINGQNKMSAEDFFAINSFPSSVITVNFEYSEEYEDFFFDKGNFIINFDQNTSVATFVVDNASSVTLKSNTSDANITLSKMELKGKSRIEVQTAIDKTLNLRTNSIEVLESSSLNIETGTLSMPLSGAYRVNVDDGSRFNLHLLDSTAVNADGQIGFGLSLSPITISQHSYFEIDNDNTNNLSFHIGDSVIQDRSIQVKKHSDFKSNGGFVTLSTSSKDKTFGALAHSSIEIHDLIQDDGGPTAFTDIDVQLFSTFASTLSGGDGNLDSDPVESFIYQV